MSYSLANMWSDRRLFRQVYRGWQQFSSTGQTPEEAYQALIALHCRSNGTTTDLLAEIVRQFRRPQPLARRAGILGALSDDRLGWSIKSLQNDGFVVFDAKLSPGVCAELKRFAETTPALPDGEGGEETRPAIYNRKFPLARRYQFSESDVLTSVPVQRLMGDESLLAFAQTYFGAAPLFDFAAMWWSSTFSEQPGHQAAQLFHFDFDRLKWIKLFFYLTDVTDDRGPHCFVRGSHRRGLPEAAPLLARGYARLTDDEVITAFGPEKIASITGPAGTIIAVDTRGFHKGLVPTAGDRLILQFQYSISEFGGAVPRCPIDRVVAPELQRLLDRHPAIFARYLRDDSGVPLHR
jgi:hypothetical protein